MLIWRISIRLDTLNSLFLISLLVHLHSCQVQATYFKDNCKYEGRTCIVLSSCPNANELISNKKATPCGFETTAEKKNPKICCNVTTRSATKTLSTPKNTPLTRLEGTPSSRNATAVAIQKCQEYAELRYVNAFKPPQLPGQNGIWYKISDCINVVTLIVRGAQAVAKEYPHMALIGYGKKFSEVEWGCGGSLISERFILSAAHCGQNSQLGPPRWALLGDLTLSSKKEDALPRTYSIVKVIDHPNYVHPVRYHDISLFQLNTTVRMSPYVRPACLHTSMTIPAGTRASISGWGKTDTAAARFSDTLLKTYISTVSEQKCEMSYNGLINFRLPRGYDRNSMICAGDLLTGNDTCHGDSGSPLQTMKDVCVWNIIGVTSFGPGVCGNREDPGIYTRVANYLGWIQSIVWP